MNNHAKRWNGTTKPSENVTFTINYADGESVEVKQGVLFTVDDDDRMDIHVGVDKAYMIFGIYFCLMEYIDKIGLSDKFKSYYYDMIDFMTGTSIKKENKND